MDVKYETLDAIGHSEVTVDIAALGLKELDESKNEIHQRAETLEAEFRKNKCQDVVIYKYWNIIPIMEIEAEDLEIMKISDNENELQEIAQDTVANRKTEQYCQICDARIQNDPDDESTGYVIFTIKKSISFR